MGLYKAQCASCHGAGLEGLQGPPLVGNDFMRVWSGPLSDLVSKILHTMPANDPGKLRLSSLPTSWRTCFRSVSSLLEKQS